MSSQEIVLAFDVYGTLLSTSSIASQLASHFGKDKADSIAAEWRKYQLEYTWRLNSMNKYLPFSEVTRNALQHALSEASVSLDEEGMKEMMNSYNSLHIFPDVPPLFTHLTQNPSIHAVLFSNGTADMINASLTSSPSLSPHAHLFQQTVVVEPVKRFKPDPKVYQHLCEQVGKKEKDVWLVTANPFDVVGANAMGLKTIWVDRAGTGWVDALGGEPTVVVKGLGEVLEKVEPSLKT